jgi:hypothetical protein
MVWGRIDDGHWRHRKVAALDDDLRKGCVCLFWLAVSWANDQGTDGRVSLTGLRQLDGTAAEADELVRVGLWERDGRAYRIHDFLDFNKSQEQIAADKAQRTAAGAAGAAARWHSDSGPHSESHGASPHGTPSEMHGGVDGGTDAPYPVSRNPYDPTPIARDGLPHIDAEATTFLEGLTGRPISVAGPKQLTEYDRQIEAHGLSAVIAAYNRVAKSLKPHPQARQLVWSALRVLEPFVLPGDLREASARERAEEEARAHQARVEATRRRTAARLNPEEEVA